MNLYTASTGKRAQRLDSEHSYQITHPKTFQDLWREWVGEGRADNFVVHKGQAGCKDTHSHWESPNIKACNLATGLHSSNEESQLCWPGGQGLYPIPGPLKCWFKELNGSSPTHIILAGPSHRNLLMTYTMQKLFQNYNLKDWHISLLPPCVEILSLISVTHNWS